MAVEQVVFPFEIIYPSRHVSQVSAFVVELAQFFIEFSRFLQILLLESKKFSLLEMHSSHTPWVVIE